VPGGIDFCAEHGPDQRLVPRVKARAVKAYSLTLPHIMFEP
jgi:hypothetical protein